MIHIVQDFKRAHIIFNICVKCQTHVIDVWYRVSALQGLKYKSKRLKLQVHVYATSSFRSLSDMAKLKLALAKAEGTLSITSPDLICRVCY